MPTPFELFESGRFREAEIAINSTCVAPTSIQVLKAQVELYVGSLHAARESALQLLDSRQVSNKEASQCWEVISRASFGVGQIRDGARAMNRALALAETIHDDVFEARLRASHVASLLHFVGADAAVTEMTNLRQLSTRTGDFRTTIAFHILAAQINVRAARFATSKHHCEIAHSLLRKHDHLWLQGRLAILEFVWAFLQSDYSNAGRHACKALEYGRESGARDISIVAGTNLAFLQIAQNKLEDAKSTLAALLVDLRIRGTLIAEIFVHDAEMQVALAERDLERARRIAGQISTLIRAAEARDSDHELWHLATLVRCHYLSGDPQTGLAVALEAIPRVLRTSEGALLERMRLLAADGLSRIGEPVRGMELICDAVKDKTDWPLDLIADTARVTARLIAGEDAAAAMAYLRRSSRVFLATGNFGGQLEVDRDIAEVFPNGSRLSNTASRTAIDETQPAQDTQRSVEVIDSIAAILDMGKHRALLADEIFALLADTRAVAHARVIKVSNDGHRHIVRSYPADSETRAPDDQLSDVRINLGQFGGNAYELSINPGFGARARATLLSIRRIIEISIGVATTHQLQTEQQSLWGTPTPERQLGLIYSSDRMQELVKMIRRVASSTVTVLLTGETGVGKELFARAIHQASTRNEKVFLPFNCGTVPRDLIDSQLFGHRRGSFTGAHADSAGVIRSAAGGTLFLDEVGEMAIETQPKLLRFLEASEILPLGETKPQVVDVRIVAATNANLDQMVADGRFREDLYYRLNVIRINIPPLRERREEIPALVEHFLDRFGRELQKPMLRVADETLEYLVLYRWPGNVRQLANELRRMVALAEPGAVLMPAHLSDDIVASRRTMPVGQAPRGFSEVMTRIDQPLAAAVEHIERAAIQRALSITDGNLEEAARVLGLSRKGLYLKRQRLNVG
jgi:DNA-binding NtrC family response regulator